MFWFLPNIFLNKESQGKTASILATAIQFNLSRMSAAKGIQDWAPPLPDLCSNLSTLSIYAKRIIILEALLSSIIIHQRSDSNNIGECSKELQDFLKTLIDGSPVGLKLSEQYSMEKLFTNFNIEI